MNITEDQRLRDLVRHQRGALHEAGLITDDEYALIAEWGSASARRLEAYDAIKRKSDQALDVLKAAYLKHHVGVDDIGWEKLSDMMCNALCEIMGDRQFQEWLSKETLSRE
jgi:hypothetical protein